MESYRFPIAHFSNSDGLSQSLISGIAQDRNGYLWIGTKDGLNRFDGYRFEVYQHEAKDPNSLSQNHIHQMFGDVKNKIWLLLQTGGLDVFDPETKIFHHLSHSNPKHPGLKNPSSKLIVNNFNGSATVVYENGEMPDWVEFGNSGSNTFKVTSLEKIYPGLQSLSPNEVTNSWFKVCKQTYLWRLAGDTLFYYTPLSNQRPNASAENIALIEKGVILLVSQHGELYVLNPKNNRLLRFNYSQNHFEEVGVIPINISSPNHCYIDKNNIFWGWTTPSEIFRFDIHNHRTEKIMLIWNQVNDYARSQGYLGFLDRNHNMWLGSSGLGLYKIGANINIFKILPLDSGFSLIPFWPYRSETKGSHAAFNPLVYQQWKALKNKLDFNRLELAPYAMGSHFTTDSEGHFWLSVAHSKKTENILAKLNPITRDLTFLQFQKASYTHWFFNPVFIDRKNHLWYGESLLKGPLRLFEVLPDNREIIHRFPVEADGNMNRFICDWEFLSNDQLLLGTTQGVFLYTPKNKSWIHYTAHSGNPNSLSSNQVLSLCLDPKEPEKFVWVGTEGDGLNKMNLTNGQCQRITKKEGLPNNVVYGILPDKHHNLWLSTNNGLCLFNPNNLAVRYFSEADGLPGNEFNRHEYSATADGILYFGGIAGTVCFDPEKFYQTPTKSKLIINQVVIEGHRTTGTKGNYTRRTVSKNLRNKLNIAPGENILTFQFSLVNLTSKSQNLFYYRIPGYQDQWVALENKNEITITNIPPGTYPLEIRATDNRFSPVYAKTGLLLMIQPFWYQTIWFKGFLLLILAGGLYALYRYRLSQVLAMEKLRNQISRDLHDEMGSTLSSISLYGAAIRNTEKNISDKNALYLEKIINNTSGMMETMNDIVWSLNAENANNESLINRMKSFAVQLTEPADIRLQFEVNDAVLNTKLQPEHRKNIYLLFKEIIHNAVKHSRGRNIQVTVQGSPNTFELKVSDDGIGFNPIQHASESFNSGGHGIQGMKKRAADIKSSLTLESHPGQGTTITLILKLTSK